jgi:steroid delta-isomerase-like uncharacterized protein
MQPNSSVEANIALVRKALDAINRGDLATLASTVTADFVRTDLAQAFVTDGPGSGDLTDFIGVIRAAVPDFKMTIVDIFATEDQAAAQIKLTGTHVGEVLGVPGNGGHLDFNGVSLYHFRDGLINANSQLLDLAGLLRQLQAPAQPPAEPAHVVVYGPPAELCVAV